MTLAIQKFMRGPWEHAGRPVTDLPTIFATLRERYAIVAKRHPHFPNLVLFKYDQVSSPFAETIVRECRGIILDESNGWAIVSRAFDKFFNHGEGHAAEIDWSTARVQEKVDGSLCVVYPYANEWHVATSGMPDAGGNINGVGKFSELFWKTFEQYGNPFAILLPGNVKTCFSFELTSPDNRVVVPHAKASLTLLGARTIGGEEMPVKVAADILRACGSTVEAVQSFGLQSFAEIGATFASMSPLKQEGYVVVDAAFRRVKVKHPGYVALHHAKGGMTRKAFVEIARSGETSEVIAAFPEFKPLLDEACSKVNALVADIESDYARLAAIPEQKAFAIEAMKTRCSGALFALRTKKAASARESVAKMRMENLMELLGYRGVEEAPVVAEENQ